MRRERSISGFIALALCVAIIAAICFWPGKIKVMTYPLIETVGSAMAYDGDKDYNSIGGDGYIIKYQPDQRHVAYMVENSLKKYSGRVYNFFGYHPSEPVKIIIYGNVDDMHDALHISRNRTVEGAYYMGKIAILSPYEWTYAPKGDIDSYFEASSPIVHELTHMVVDEMTRGNVPVWLTEGLATYMEYRMMGYDWTSNIDAGEPYSMEQLTRHFDKLDEYRAYRQSFLMVKDMVDRYGQEYMLNMLASLGRGQDIDAKIFYK